MIEISNKKNDQLLNFERYKGMKRDIKKYTDEVKKIQIEPIDIIITQIEIWNWRQQLANVLSMHASTATLILFSSVDENNFALTTGMLMNEKQLSFLLVQKTLALISLAISIFMLAISISNYSEIFFLPMILWCFSRIWIFRTLQVRFRR